MFVSFLIPSFVYMFLHLWIRIYYLQIRILQFF